MAAAAINWGFGLVSVAQTDSSSTVFVYVAATTAVLVWYGWTYSSRLAIFAIYGAGVALASMLT